MSFKEVFFVQVARKGKERVIAKPLLFSLFFFSLSLETMDSNLSQYTQSHVRQSRLIHDSVVLHQTSDSTYPREFLNKKNSLHMQKEELTNPGPFPISERRSLLGARLCS